MVIWIRPEEKWLKKLFRDDVEVKYINNATAIEACDILFIRKYDVSQNEIRARYVYIIEEELEKLASYGMRRIKTCYDYFYLQYQMGRNDFDTVIAGSSYPLYGIDMSLVPSWVNLGLSSQDVYYSVAMIKKLYTRKSFKQLIVGGYYYIFCTDLSSVRNEIELSRISDVYEKLGGGFHNSLWLPETKNVTASSTIYDVHKLEELVGKEFFSKTGNSYWHRQKVRSAAKLWLDKRKNYQELSDDERDDAGALRAKMHNKSREYTRSIDENINILKKFIEWCGEKEVIINFCVFPVSRSYKKFFDPWFKKRYYSIMDELRVTNVIDFNNDTDFTDEDFVDMDHLNELGAKKLTEKLVANIEYKQQAESVVNNDCLNPCKSILDSYHAKDDAGFKLDEKNGYYFLREFVKIQKFEIPDARKNGLIIYGAGNDGKLYGEELLEIGVENFFYCDINLAGTLLLGKKIITPQDINSYPGMPVVIASRKYGREIYRTLKRNGVDEKRVYLIF